MTETLDMKEDSVTLPLDVLGIVAKCLVDDHAYGTCAALNVASRDVEAETTPILWKTFVLWGAKKFQSFPESVWAKGAAASPAIRSRIKILESVLWDEWAKIERCKGAKWIQYLAIPSLFSHHRMNWDISWKLIGGGLPGTLPVNALPRLKAIIVIGAKIAGKAQGELGITVIPRGPFRYGFDDLLRLSEAIDDFQHLGGTPVKTACNHSDGIWFIEREVPTLEHIPSSDAVSQKHRVTPSNPPYVPKAVELSFVEENEARYAAAFSEVLAWSKVDCEGSVEPKQILLSNGSSEFNLRCARLFQQAVEADPIVATFLIRIRLVSDESSSSSAAVNKDVKGIIDIFRQTYLRTHPHLSLEKAGQLWIGLKEAKTPVLTATWGVGPSAAKRAIVSRYSRGREIGVLATDSWGEV